MYGIFDFNNFAFNRYTFNKYHYTDSRSGALMNYFAYMIKGNAKLVTKTETVKIKTGDIFFIPVNLPYESYWYADGEIEFLSFGFINLETGKKLNLSIQAVDCPESIKPEIQKIPTEGFDVSFKALGMFYILLSDIMPYLKKTPKKSNKQEILKSAEKYISLNPDCTVKELAQKLYISESYLYLLFKENLGCSPHDYSLKAKCRKGINYLLTTDKTLEEISDLTGFSSASHFRRVLKAQTGMLPKEIRKNNEF